jgi:hypothetical protein
MGGAATGPIAAGLAGSGAACAAAAAARPEANARITARISVSTLKPASLWSAKITQSSWLELTGVELRALVLAALGPFRKLPITPW